MILTFPPIFSDILRFVSPTCTLTLTSNLLKNYFNTCTVKGIRLIIPFIDTLVLGSTYILTISGLINPTTMSPYYSKYTIEIGDSSNSNLVLKTFSSLCNYIMPIFQQNSALVYLNYYDGFNNLINTVDTYAGVQSSGIYFAPSTPIAASTFNRNTLFTSSSTSIISNPSTISFVAGSNPTAVTFSTLNSGVQYIYFTKTGDGSYYSNLPPLTLITDLNYYQQVTVLNTAYSMPVATVGTNYTLIVTLPFNLYPMTTVNMSVTIPTDNGISLISNPSIITFYPSQPSASIMLYIDDSTKWTVGATTTLILTPSSSYSGTVTLTLTGVASGASPTSGSVSSIANGLQQKYYTFNVQCNSYGYFYYHIERTFTYNSSACSLNLTQIKSYALASSISGIRVT
jgi:hypothetical protein